MLCSVSRLPFWKPISKVELSFSFLAIINPCGRCLCLSPLALKWAPPRDFKLLHSSPPSASSVAFYRPWTSISVEVPLVPCPRHPHALYCT